MRYRFGDFSNQDPSSVRIVKTISVSASLEVEMPFVPLTSLDPTNYRIIVCFCMIKNRLDRSVLLGFFAPDTVDRSVLLGIYGMLVFTVVFDYFCEPSFFYLHIFHSFWHFWHAVHMLYSDFLFILERLLL